MRGKAVGMMVALGIVLGLSWEAKGEIYVWTDERGVVHMTDQWANVPESMRSQVSVRESSPVSRDALPIDEPRESMMSPVEPHPEKPSPLQMPSDLAEMPPPTVWSPSVAPDLRGTSVLIPDYRPFVHRPKKPSPPFPYNVRLDPYDKDFVWVGPNRVPKDTFTYPRVSLDQQAQFRDRIRRLEQRRSKPPKAAPTPPVRP
jgi:Domain of unknown function (DUF4124)